LAFLGLVGAGLHLDRYDPAGRAAVKLAEATDMVVSLI
jgi:hypothetical protein